MFRFSALVVALVAVTTSTLPQQSHSFAPAATFASNKITSTATKTTTTLHLTAEEAYLEDFHQSWRLMEKRAKEGPGSLTTAEISDLEQRTSRIIGDMKQINYQQTAAAAAAAAPVAAAPAAPAVPGGVHNTEEGEAYDGSGGLGLAKGTANTWALEGMEEMSPEEYREALQESVSARQRDRRASGTTGNLSSNNYLNNL
jgi:hypothetical protein